MADNNNINPNLEDQNIGSGNQTVFAKPFPDVSKIEVFSGQNFRRWQERVSTLLDMYGVATALASPKPDTGATTKQIEDWTHANKVCRHTLLSALSNDLFDVYCSYKEAKDIWDSLILKYTAEDIVRQRFVIGNYYRWEMIEDKDIKIQINEYHKLLEDIKTENIILPDEFVSELLIEKLPSSWTDYKQQLKHRHKQMSLQELITHIIIEDTNRKECVTARAKALSTKANMVVEDKPTSKRLVDAFEGNIASAVEEGISEKIKEGIMKLDNFLESLPKSVSLDKTAALNVSFVGNPVLSNSSIAIAINGLFTGKKEVLLPQGYHQKELKISSACGGLPKMIKISIHENVFKSASQVYFNAGKMQLIVDELPDQAILNTAEWRFIVPQLYKRYPNDDMQLNISMASPPVIQVTYQDVGATILVDITIEVLEDFEVIPVASISVEISASCAVEIVGNDIVGRLTLQELSTYLKWSKIGKLHMRLIQSLMSSVLKTVVLPYLNLKLKRGFPLPIIDGYGFQNAIILYNHPWIAVCSDVSFFEDYYLGQQ